MRPENREHLGPHDILLATHPGSGTSWIATLLVRLGIFYVSGDDEFLLDDVSQRTGGMVENQNLPLPGAKEGGALQVSLQQQRAHLALFEGIRVRIEEVVRAAVRVLCGVGLGRSEPGYSRRRHE